MSKWQNEINDAKKSDCRECNMAALAQLRVCEVCRLIDKDETLKLCKWCGVCNAWICESDETNYIRRGAAFFKRTLTITDPR